MRMTMMVLAAAAIAAPAGAQVANLIPAYVTGGMDEATPAEAEAFYACMGSSNIARRTFHGRLRPNIKIGRQMTAQQQSDLVGEAVDASELCTRQHGYVRYNVRRLFDVLMAAGPPAAATPQP